MTLSLDSVIDHHALGLDNDDLLELYRLMVTARKLDERMWALNRQGRVPFVVSVSGHEATQVGAAYAIDTNKDWSLPYYRDVAYALAAGISPYDIFAGVFAKDIDPSSGGRQMPNHWSAKDLNIFTQSSVIAVQYTQACGIAYELKRQGKDSVVIVDGGEGSTSEGDWHEAMNFAGIHKLPVIFLVQNNLYSISVPAESEIAGTVSERAQGYGMPGVVVDGNNILEVYGATAAAVERARAGDGPTLIEAKTYRYYAHTSDDDDKLYRSREEVELWRRKDPIPNFRQYLVEQRVLTEAKEREIDEQVADEIAAAVKETEASPDPMDPFSHVFALPIEPSEPVLAIDDEPEGESGNMITAINRTLHELMDEIDDMVIFGEDVADPKGGVFKATAGLTDSFGEDRSFNTPISEALVIGVGIGIAATGSKPLAEIQFADFIHPAFDAIVSEVARTHYRSNGEWALPMTIRAPYGGGIHGAMYHSQSIEAFYAHVPGLKIVVPSTPADAAGLLRAAMLDPDPVMYLEPKKLYRLAKGAIPEGLTTPIGKAALRTIGDDLTIIAYGTMSHFAVEAAAQLSEEGIEATVLDLRSLRPLDWPSIEAAVQRTSKVLIVHEDNRFLGYGAEVAAQIAEKSFEWLDAPVRRYTAPDVPSFPFAASLEKQLMPDVEGIVREARELAKW
ncbi:MAG: alpha-ketoacid dehydrogenase subunit alpha/beta [Acidimicrobiia bacterium]